MKLSRFGRRFSDQAGIVRLMDDLGEALSGDGDMLMLGGGNPGHIPQMQALFRERMQKILDDGDAFERLVGNYGPPQGAADFARALASLLHRTFGWDVGPANIAITNGSQSATFMLFNLLAGEGPRGDPRRVLLPVIPEYIGYGDQGLGDGLFTASRPGIELLDDDQFKYRVDFDRLRIGNDTAAVCASRPTNPTGNVLTDDEVARLLALCGEHDIPLILDCAYGAPFPGIVFEDATPVWNEQVIVCLSLSKLGLPGVRTGIVVAHEDVVRALTGVNAILNLTTGGFGPALALDLVESGEILRVSEQVVRPFYRDRARESVALLRRELAGYDFHVHKPEGAIFLWLWFRGLPVSSQELYLRLRARGVLVLSGHNFFPGLEEPWDHTGECIRVTVSQDRDDVRRGLGIICEEVRRAYDAG